MYGIVCTVFLGTLVASVHSDCGTRTVLLLKPFTKTVIKSPETSSGTYPPNSTCSWVIIPSADVPNTMRVMVQVDEIEIGCPGDYLRLYDGLSPAAPKIFDEFRCNPKSNRTDVNIISGRSFAEFKSDEDNVTGIGFQLTFLPAVDASGTGCSSTESLIAEDTEKYITSPKFPDNFPLNSACSWNITTKENKSVEAVLYFLDVDDADSCAYHALEIYSDSGKTNLCDKGSWTNRSFTGDAVGISFTTDALNSRKGFLIGYKSVNKSVTVTTTETQTTTVPADYWDVLYPDYNKALPDIFYVDPWNNPARPTMPIEKTTVPPEATTQPRPMTTQPGFWDSLWPSMFYWNYFF